MGCVVLRYDQAAQPGICEPTSYPAAPSVQCLRICVAVCKMSWCSQRETSAAPLTGHASTPYTASCALAKTSPEVTAGKNLVACVAWPTPVGAWRQGLSVLQDGRSNLHKLGPLHLVASLTCPSKPNQYIPGLVMKCAACAAGLFATATEGVPSSQRHMAPGVSFAHRCSSSWQTCLLPC